MDSHISEEVISMISVPLSLHLETEYNNNKTKAINDVQCLKPITDYLNSESLFSVHKSEVFDNDAVPIFTRNIIICILTEAMNELSILRSVNLKNDLGTNPNKLINYVSLEDRYMGQENHSEYRINSPNNTFDKLAKDINMIYVILAETCREIWKFGQCRCLEECVHSIKLMHQEEEELLKDERNQERIIQDMKTKCEEERLENIRTIEETDAKIQALRFESEDIFIYGQLEVQYFEQWQKTRLEQNSMKCDEKEAFFSSTIKGTEEKIEMENSCHNELAQYFEETKDDYLEGIQEWMKRYDEEVEKLEEDTINLRSDLEKITEDRKISQEKYEKRQIEINDWLEYRRIKEEKELQRLKEIAAATKIQAWWRGTMVRKKLGPFRKKRVKTKIKAKIRRKSEAYLYK